MSTKNLARTLIEGGRASYNKGQRKHSHSQERVLTRAYLARASQYDDGFDAHVIGIRPKVLKDFADKLGAPRRWLDSHVGQPWSKVRSEMFQRFDPRSLAGRHIIFGHLLREVMMWNDPQLDHYRYTYVIDRNGILRERDRRERRARFPAGKRWRSGTEIRAWSAGRKVGGTGDALFWCVVARRCPPCLDRDDQCCCPKIDGRHWHGPHAHYRQDQRLTRDEIVFWRSLLEDVQDQLRHPAVDRKARQ